LVGERDRVAGAARQRAREVLVRAEPLRVALDPHRERRLAGKRLGDGNGGVGRAVVADDELVGQTGLRGDRVELGAEKPRPVVGGHGDGDGRESPHGGSVPGDWAIGLLPFPALPRAPAPADTSSMGRRMADNGSAPQRILIICGNTFGPRMSSPGIRARHMAEVLSAALPESRVTLAIPHGSEPIGDPATLPYRVTHFSPMKVPRLIFEHDIVIANEYPAVAMAAFPWKKFILDYYTIYLLEWLENSRDTLLTRPRKRQSYMATQQRLVRLQLPFADFLLTANDRQK